MLKTIDELKITGWNALVEKLGVAEATKYLLQYQKGSGNYTKDRRRYFNNVTLKNIITDIKNQYPNNEVKKQREYRKKTQVSYAFYNYYLIYAIILLHRTGPEKITLNSHKVKLKHEKELDMTKREENKLTMYKAVFRYVEEQ